MSQYNQPGQPGPYGGQPYNGQPGPQSQPSAGSYGYPQQGYGQPSANPYGQPSAGYPQNTQYPEPTFSSATPPPGYGSANQQKPPKPKRTNPLLWVGLGCLALLLALVIVIVVIMRSSAPKTASIGEDITMGKYVASVDGVDCSKKTIKGLFGSTYTAKRGQYCAVQITVTNHSSSTIYLDADKQILVIGSDEYPYDSSVTSTTVVDNAMSFSSLEPEATDSYVVFFDSPSSTPDKLKLQVGSFSNAKKAEVSLKK